MIDRLADAGIPIDRCCRVLGVARQHYYRVKRKPLTQSELRRQWLTGMIREVHVTSRGTYGYRRVHAELTMAMGVTVSERTVHKADASRRNPRAPRACPHETTPRYRHSG